ncbi:heat shock factor binding protein 1-domain-containing protein [Hysterangium stoloniferum]|nr:heat shock factor binding protein 1-domain-containing protein [Hysterangium stoloniferum]
MPPPSEPFKALKVTSSTSNAVLSDHSSAQEASKSAPKPEDISSPHELTAFVETLLGQLETRFEDMSAQILDRMTQMSARVDSLESSIQDLINGDMTGSAPQSPVPHGMLRHNSG